MEPPAKRFRVLENWTAISPSSHPVSRLADARTMSSIFHLGASVAASAAAGAIQTLLDNDVIEAIYWYVKLLARTFLSHEAVKHLGKQSFFNLEGITSNNAKFMLM